VLFLLDENGKPVLLQKKINNKNSRWSKHGLGHLLNPIDPKSDNPKCYYSYSNININKPSLSADSFRLAIRSVIAVIV